MVGAKENVVEKRSETMTESVEKHSDEILYDKLKWMNSKDAAVYLRVSVGHLRNLVWQGRVKVYRLSNRLRFLRSDLDWLMLNPPEPRSERRYRRRSGLRKY